MTNSDKEIAAAAGARPAESGNRHFELRPLDPTQSRSQSPAPQPDRLAEKFEAALAAALRRDASEPAVSVQPASSGGDSSDVGQPDEQLASDDTVTNCTDPNDRPALMDGGQAHCRDAIAQDSPPVTTCAALRPPRLALAAPQISAEPDGNSPSAIVHLVQPAGDFEEDCLEWIPERRPSESEAGSLQTQHPPHTNVLAVPQDEGDREPHNRSSEPANLGDPVDSREETVCELGSLAPWPRLCDGNLIRRGVLPVAILAVLTGFGTALLMPVVAPGSPPAETVADDGATTDASAFGATDRDPIDQRWELSDDRIDGDTAAHVPQEPITPKLVKTVRITGTSDQSTKSLPHPEPPPLGLVGSLSPEQTGVTAIVRTDAQHSSESQAGPDASGAEWSETAVENASPAEGGEFGEREAAAGEEALVESEPHVAEPGRWPNSIPFQDGGQTGDRVATASEADELKLSNDESAPSEATAAPASEGAAAETDKSSASDPVGEGRSAEPTNFAPVTADVNMRGGPGNDAPVITVVPSGRRVGVIGCTTWCEVTFEGERGWVHRSFVSGQARSDAVRADPAGDRLTAGTPLISADGSQIGIIRSLTTDDNGQEFVVVDLAQGLNAAVPSIRLKTAYIAASGEQARINVTRARFVNALPSKSGAEASAVTGANR